MRASASSASTTVRVPGMSTQVVVARLAGLTGRAAELRQLATQIVMLRNGRVTALGGVKVLTA